MNSTEHVKELLSTEHPTIFSVSAISDVAEACGIEYGKALSFIERSRAQGRSTHECLEQLVFCYKPELLNH